VLAQTLEEHVSDDTRRGKGSNTARQVEEEIEKRVGHPTSVPPEDLPESTEVREAQADERLGVAPRSHQHARKGQVESPREVNINQPEKKREGHR
jgi:hypothetical protein